MQKCDPLIANRSNVAVVEDYFRALDNGDMELLGSILADDIIWHQPGSGPLSGTYRGKEEVFALLSKFMQLSDGTFEIDLVRAITPNGDMVSSSIHFQAKRSGEVMAMDGVDLMRVQSGKIGEVWLFSSEQEAEDRFWGR